MPHRSFNDFESVHAVITYFDPIILVEPLQTLNMESTIIAWENTPIRDALLIEV